MTDEHRVTISAPSWPTIVGKVIEPPKLARPRGAQRARSERRATRRRRVVTVALNDQDESSES